MDDASLFNLYQEYLNNPNNDQGGYRGEYIADLVLEKCGDIKNLHKWLMEARLSALEKEALEKEK